MDKKQVLAERRLRMERDGVAGLQDVALQIGFPQWGTGGDGAVCAIAIAGLEENMLPVCGRDFFDVLVKAARALRQYCSSPPGGIRFFYLGDPLDDRDPYEGDPLDPEPLAGHKREFDDGHRKGWEVVVARKILMREEASDERRELVLQVGHPYWLSEFQQAACPIVLRGEREHEIEHRYGRDLFAALSRAIRAINDRFTRPQCGHAFFWPDGKPYHGDHPYDPPLPLKRDPREIPGNWQVLAERTLLMERDDDPTRRQITIKIGYPYWSEEGKESRCPKQIVGLSPNLPASSGSNSYVALIYALDFFNMIYMRRNMGLRFFWPDGTPYEGEPLDREPGA